MSERPPWPENRSPTADELATWLEVCSPSQRLRVAEQALDSGERASNCFLRDHEGQLAHLEAQRLAEHVAIAAEAEKQRTPIHDQLLADLAAPSGSPQEGPR